MDKNSLLYWGPKLVGLQLHVPRTEWVEIPHEVLRRYMDDQKALDTYREKIISTAAKIGYPLFLRTDQASGKHNWKESCFIPDEESLFSHIYRVVEFNFIADILGLPCEALVFREYIPLEAAFTAFDEMPIAKEYRFFIRNRRVQCFHPYWPEGAVAESWTPLPDNWRKLLHLQNNMTGQDLALLTAYAHRVTKRFNGYWSIDFAHAHDGRWLLIDMALGEQSFHSQPCKFAPKKRKVRQLRAARLEIIKT